MGSAQPAAKSRGICEFCLQTICRSNKTWNTHHEGFRNIQASAVKPCIFCATLFRDIKTRCRDSDSNDLRWPVYRWNLWSVARIRDSQDIVALTFRSIAVDTDDQLRQISSNLPDRVFHFYREQDLGQLPRLAELGETTNGEPSRKQITKWIENCRKLHPHCQRRENTFVPTRLLDLAEIDVRREVYGRIRVVETKPNDIKGPYVTLSHCWGPDPSFVRLLPSNYQELTRDGISWDDPDLPKTFRDAILVARYMGIRYIWIDSLCIVQSETAYVQGLFGGEWQTAFGDFGQQADLMHQYYRFSYCNISAADSEYPGQGLFRWRQTGQAYLSASLVPPTFVSEPSNRVFGKHQWRVIAEDLWDSELLQRSLYGRGWVFQERMLSPRLVHFACNQIFWDCATISATEGLPNGIPRFSDVSASTDRHWREQLQDGFSLKHRPLAGTADLSIESFWKSAVRRYTSCKLTNGSDKLYALWGIAKLVRDALGERYATGLWSDALEEQLCWRVVDCQQADGQASKRSTSSRAPTWSWASVDGVIELHDRRPRSAREYYVLDHFGEPIKFQLPEDPRSSNRPSRMQSPQEDYETWLEGVRRLEQERSRKSSDTSILPLSRKNTLSRTTSMTTEASRDENRHPELEDDAIAVQGHVREGLLLRKDKGDAWILKPREQETTTLESGESKLEVFPDEPLAGLSQKCWFVVLAYSRENPQREGEPYDPYESEDDDDFDDVDQADDGPQSTFFGSGIILKQIGDAQYHRSGSFHFEDFNEEMLGTLTQVHDRPGDPKDIPLTARGQRFWLV